MVAAQTVMYLAPGRQYDKYIKMIAGVMILMLFISPFVSGASEIEQEWQQGVDQMMQKLDGQDYGQEGQNQWGSAVTQEAIVSELEETIAARLDQVNENAAYRVWMVTLELQDGAADEMNFAEADWKVERIDVVMEKTDDLNKQENSSDEMTPIIIEKIVVDPEETEQQTEEEETYRKLFADTLGLEEERVEVTCRGGW
jgi:hypothetical protein